MKIVVVALLFIALAGCERPTSGVSPIAEAATHSEQLNAWLDQEFATYLDFSPMAKTRLGDKSDYDQLDDPSDAAADERLSWRRASVAAMQSQFDRAQLDVEAQRSYDLWVFMLKRAEEAERFRRYEYVFGRSGPHTGLPNALINFHKVDSVADMKAYISRLVASGAYLDAYLTRAKLAAEAGVRAPYFDYDVALSQIRRVNQGFPFTGEGQSALWRDITTKIGALVENRDLSESDGEGLEAAAKTAIVDHMKPAYDRIVAWLIEDRRNVPDVATGAWALPDGDA